MLLWSLSNLDIKLKKFTLSQVRIFASVLFDFVPSIINLYIVLLS